MQQKIKILECIRQGKIGGGESHLLSLVENLNRQRYEPVVLSFTDGPMVKRLEEMAVKTHVIHTEKPFDVRKWRQVKRFLHKEGVKLVHAHGTRACSNVLWAARSLKIPVIYTIHGWSFHRDQHPVVQRMRIMGERYLTANAQVNIAVSESNRASGKERIPALDAVVVNNGINRQKFTPERKLSDIRGELGILQEEKLVLFIARFTAHKQPITLIRAFAEAVKVQPELRLLMVGDGDQKEEALALVQELRLGDRIIFQSFRQDVPDVLGASDIFVLPSLWEGLPIGLLEAMAMGKAVIATKVDGTVEVLQHRENGIMIEPGKVDALKDALLELGRDEALRNNFGRKALETVEKRFNAVHMTREIENIYEKLLNGGSPS